MMLTRLSVSTPQPRFGAFTPEQQTQLKAVGLPLETLKEHLRDSLKPLNDGEKNHAQNISGDMSPSNFDEFIREAGSVGAFEEANICGMDTLVKLSDSRIEQFATVRKENEARRLMVLTCGIMAAQTYQDVQNATYTPSEQYFQSFLGLVQKVKSYLDAIQGNQTEQAFWG